MPELKTIYLTNGVQEYPKIATVEFPPEKDDLVTVMRQLPPAPKKMKYAPNALTLSFMSKHIEPVAAVTKLPADYKPTIVHSMLSETGIMSGVVVTDWKEEVALYQLLLFQLVNDKVLSIEEVESKFNRVVKLLTMAEGDHPLANKETRAEAKLARQRCLTTAKQLCQTSLKEKETYVTR